MPISVLKARLRAVPAVLAFLCVGVATLPARADDAFSTVVPVLAAPAHLDGTIDDSWSKAASVPVSFDFTFQRQGEATVAWIGQDARALYVAFAVTQKEPLTSAQETNGPGVLNDDNVAVVMWPQGANGFQYRFSANARGARYQSSSENSSYSPQWSAVARRTSTGYTVTMRIPFDVIRSGSATEWEAQFERTTIATGGVQVWEHRANQRNPDDVAFAGTLQGISVHQNAATRPRPRLQLYGLSQFASAAAGGRTARMGADVALPLTATSSLLGTFHPDYSNLEVDQQTIAPNAYARQFNEFRPFFTQAASNFNQQFSCTNCPTTLYTPSIPQFREGYAYEGTQGPLSFGAFDAVGYSRSDSAEVLDYTINNPRTIAALNLQRISVNLPGFRDDTTLIDAGYANQHTHYFVYFNGAEDRGTNVTEPGFGDYFEYGGGYVTQLTTAGITLQKIGSQFLPADGFVAQPNIAGYASFYNRTLNFSPTSSVQDIVAKTFFARYHDQSGNVAQTDGAASVQFDFRDLLSAQVYQGSTGIEVYNGAFLPFNSNGVYLGYKVKTTTPSSISWSTGLYFNGALNSWSYITTQPLRHRLNLSLEADENVYASKLTAEPVAKQWLERAGLDWQFSRQASLDVGVRRIIGRNLPNSFQVPDFPTSLAPCGTPNGFNPFDCVNAANASFAFHFLESKNEFYVVYGNPNSLATTPALYLKWIRYIGAEKGT